jgi:predicted metalloendopeptidase
MLHGALVSQEVFFSNDEKEGRGELRKEQPRHIERVPQCSIFERQSEKALFRASRVKRTAKKIADVERDRDAEREENFKYSRQFF